MVKLVLPFSYSTLNTHIALKHHTLAINENVFLLTLVHGMIMIMITLASL